MKKNIVYSDIKKKIITGEFSQGESLNEKDLTEIFKISRTPVREALNILELEGWIKSVPRKGYVVSSITFSDIKDLFQIRYELEPVFLSMAFNFFEKEVLISLKERIQNLIEKEDYDALRLLDDEFHSYLIESTYNSFAIKTMESINDHISRTRYLTFRDKKETFDSAYDHIKIIDALLEKNLEQAVKVLRNHIDKSQLYFLRNFNFKG